MKKQEAKQIKALAKEIAQYGKLPKQLKYGITQGYAILIEAHEQDKPVNKAIKEDAYYRTSVSIVEVGVEKTLKKMKTWRERYAFAVKHFEPGSVRALHYGLLLEGRANEALEVKQNNICVAAPTFQNVGEECTTTIL
jgi:hypothetical protein